MYIYHLYFMLQGLAALYFVAVTVPSVALELYTSYGSSTVPTFFTARSTSASSTPVIAHSDTDDHSIYISACSTVQTDDSDYAQGPDNSSLLPVFHPHPLRQFVLFPPVLEKPHDRAEYSATYRTSSVALEAIAMQRSSSMFGGTLYLLALAIVLGALATRRLVGSSKQQPRDDGNMDRTNSDWLRQVLPESIAEREILEDREAEDRFVSQTDVFGLWPRLGGSDIFSGFAVPPTPAAVPSGVIVQSARTSERTVDVMNPPATDLLASSRSSSTSDTPPPTTRPIVILYDHPNDRISSTPAINSNKPIESKPGPINEPNDHQSAKQSAVLPSRQQFPLVPNFGPSILVTPPFGRTIPKERNTRIESGPDEAKRVGVWHIPEGAMSNERPTTPAIMQPAITSPAQVCATPLKRFGVYDSDLRVGSMAPVSPLTPADPVYDPEHFEQPSGRPHPNAFDTSSSEGSLGPITPEVPIRQLQHGTPAMLASTNPYIGRVLKEFDYYNNDQQSFDNSPDMLSPTRLIKRSGSFGSFPGLFASPHASASDLVALIATPMTFPPWKFDELIPPTTPLKNTPPVPDNRTEITLGASRPLNPKLVTKPFTENEEPSLHLDTRNEDQPKEMKEKFEWDDKAFDEQELRWRSAVQPRSSTSLEIEENFWTQFESNISDDSDQSSCWWTPNESAS